MASRVRTTPEVVALARFADSNQAPLATALRTTAEYWEEAVQKGTVDASLGNEQAAAYRALEARLTALVDAITDFGDDG